jgi:hypothetical protein
MRNCFCAMTLVAFALAGAAELGGCGKSSSGSSEGTAVISSSGADREALIAAISELQRHWLKRPDGWTTAVISGSAYSPERYLRQCRALVIDQVQPTDLSESDKLNGLEWQGSATLKPTSCREAGGDGGIVLDGMGSFGPNRERGQWSPWVDFTPGPMRLEKTKDGWQYQWDGSYLRGTLPAPQDFASAGVSQEN